MTQRSHQALVVNPGDPFQGRQLHGFACLPRSTTVDQLGLVPSIDRLGQDVIDCAGARRE